MKSFLQGKKTLSVAPLRPLASPALVPSTPAAKAAPKDHEHAGGQAQVEVIKEGDKVVRLVVICSCGERIDIECLYSGS